jgi:hypothetical protein
MSAHAGLQPRAQGSVRVLAKPLEIVFKRFFEGVSGTPPRVLGQQVRIESARQIRLRPKRFRIQVHLSRGIWPYAVEGQQLFTCAGGVAAGQVVDAMQKGVGLESCS